MLGHLNARRVLGLVQLLSCVAITAAAGPARGQEECPLGSTPKSEGTQTWCEPTVCDADTQCPTGSLCRPVPLCVEIGTLEQAPGTKSDAGQRLLVRQRCGADKACPQKTTCSEKSRCITRAQAEKAGLLTVTAASAAKPAGSADVARPGPSGEASKKACGCHAPGSRGGELGGGTLALLAVAVVAARRRSRAAGRGPCDSVACTATRD